MYEADRAPVTLREIYHQADSCQRTIQRAAQRNRIFEQFLPLTNYSDIIITGCGSSLNLAMCASFAWSEMLKRPVIGVASSELAHFPEHYVGRDSRPLVIAITRSGATTEVKLAVDRMKGEHGARALAITSDIGDVAAACDAEINFTECREQSVVMTQAFTCMLTGLYLLADGASGSGLANEIKPLAHLIDKALRSTDHELRALAEDENIARFFFLGSGPMKGLADECALKMTEMALNTAFSYRTLEFRHGPKAILNSSDQVIIFPVEAERQHLNTLLGEIAATEARALVIGEDHSAILNPQSEIFRPALYAHVGQLLGYWRASARELNPDAPRHLARTVVLNV
jgi:glucosamine--fructose-6-phosphate aminotransferase (isomerizing)